MVEIQESLSGNKSIDFEDSVVDTNGDVRLAADFLDADGDVVDIPEVERALPSADPVAKTRYEAEMEEYSRQYDALDANYRDASEVRAALAKRGIFPPVDPSAPDS